VSVAAFHCDQCETYYSSLYRQGRWAGDYFLCDGCFAEHCGDCGRHFDDCDCESESLHNYSYRPHLVFSGAGPLFMGVELETEGNGNGVGARVAQLNDDRDLYCKEDGSLCDGCEIVSHPRDLASWRDFSSTFAEILAAVSEEGGRAWDRSNAGLHVHVSRAAFDSPSHLARFVWLWGRNESRVVRYAGRRSSYADFESLRAGGLVKKCGRGIAGGHSAAVNLSNSDTVEIRVFRPSLAVGRVFSYLEAVHASWIYTSTLRASDVALGALTWDRFTSFVLNGEDFPVFAHHLRGGRFRTSETLAGSLVGARDLVSSFDGEV